MNLTNYLTSLATKAAAFLGYPRTVKRLPKAAPPAPAKRKLPTIEQRNRAAFSAFPNHFGNYLGKRDPRPEAPLMTPRERFMRLLAAFECRARNYRWKQAA